MDYQSSVIKARIKKDYDMYNACQRVCDSNYLVSLAMVRTELTSAAITSLVH